MGMFLHFLLVLLTSMLLVLAQDQSGFISIDCGLPENSSYTEKTTGINYISDAKFIDVGVSKRIFESEIFTHQQLGYVRSFPSGVRNCYKINVTSGTKYLIRATFYYGNYDDLNKPPQFDLHLGTNLWATVEFPSYIPIIIFSEIIYTPSLDYIQPCLINTDNGTPFISSIELRNLSTPFISSIELRNLSSEVYVTDTTNSVITLLKRLDLGSITNLTYRYKDDVYDRIWFPYETNNWTRLSKSLNPEDVAENNYKPPAIVMSTAATPVNATDPMNFSWGSIDVNDEYHIYMHFTEVEKLTPNETRSFNITLNDKFLYGPEIPKYQGTNTLFNKQPLTGSTMYRFSLFKTHNSTLPPILNALELYKVLDFSQS